MAQPRMRASVRAAVLTAAGSALLAGQFGLAALASADASGVTVSVSSGNIDPASAIDPNVTFTVSASGQIPTALISVPSLPSAVSFGQLPNYCTQSSRTAVSCDVNGFAQGGKATFTLPFNVPNTMANSGPVAITMTAGSASATGTYTFDRVSDYQVISNGSSDGTLDSQNDFVSSDSLGTGRNGFHAAVVAEGPDSSDTTVTVTALAGATLSGNSITLESVADNNKTWTIPCTGNSGKESCDLGVLDSGGSDTYQAGQVDLYIPAHATTAPEKFQITASSPNLQTKSSESTTVVTFNLTPNGSTQPTTPTSGGSSNPASGSPSAASSSSGTRLAHTGASDTTWFAAGAAVLLAAGGAVFMTTRRGRRASR
jgi:LPXTG-motif cell wall-anchored protein